MKNRIVKSKRLRKKRRKKYGYILRDAFMEQWEKSKDQIIETVLGSEEKLYKILKEHKKGLPMNSESP